MTAKDRIILQKIITYINVCWVVAAVVNIKLSSYATLPAMT